MKPRVFLRNVFTFAAVMMLCPSAEAALFRAYVSSNGNDANPCTLPAPCRLLPAALAAVADGGEIWMLDSANYNTATVTIGKSVSVLAIPGAVGSVVALGGPAISITADGLAVALRNVVIVPFPGASGTDGVILTGASVLTIENGLIAKLPGNGVNVTGAGSVRISNSTIRDNGNYAVYLQDGAAATISRTQMLGNVTGGVRIATLATSDTSATISDSVISGGRYNIGAQLPFGISTQLSSPGTAKAFVTRSTIEGSYLGLFTHADSGGAGGFTGITISDCMITNNYNALFTLNDPAHGLLPTQSIGNNHIADNVNFGGAALVNLGPQ